MARVNITDDVLRRDPEPPRTPAAPAPREQADDTKPASEKTRQQYKFTANLDDDEYDQLEALTAAIVTELAPRPVGKGWRARIVRTLIQIAAEDSADGRRMRKRIVADLRKR